MINDIAKKLFILFLAIPFIAVAQKTVLAASFKFSPNSITSSINCDESLSLLVNTEGKKSNAADIEILYNPSLVQVVSVEPGDAYAFYIENSINSTTGKIHLAAASITNPLEGEKNFAVIHYKLLQYTAEKVNFDINFTGIGKTLDSNIAEDATSLDILSSVQNASITPQNSQDCGIDTTPPTINEIEKSTTLLTLELLDQGSGVDINSVKIYGAQNIYSLSDLKNTLSGNLNDYYLEITLPADFNSNSVQITVNDIAKNSATKTISLINRPGCSTDNVDQIYTRCEKINEIISPTLNSIITNINVPLLGGLGSFSLLAAIIEAIAAINLFRTIFMSGIMNRRAGSKLVAILVNAINQKPIRGDRVLFYNKDDKVNYSVLSDRNGFVYYKGTEFDGKIKLPFTSNEKLSFNANKNIVPTVYLDTNKNSAGGIKGIFIKASHNLINLDNLFILVDVLVSLLVGVIGFFASPSIGSLLIPVLGLFLFIVSVVLEFI